MSAERAMTHAELGDHIRAFARTISVGPLGIIELKPEPWASVDFCFANAAQKANRDGGAGVCGWVFHYRVLAVNQSLGYLVARHHAVWQRPDGFLFDVTPQRQEEKHRAYGPKDGWIVFLADPLANPVITDRALGPLPSKFYPLTDDPELVAYVRRLSRDEEATVKRIYAEPSDTRSGGTKQ